jgi:hypothetical protein
MTAPPLSLSLSLSLSLTLQMCVDYPQHPLNPAQ